MKILTYLTFIALLPLSAYAQIIECDGVVTNKECAAGTGQQLFQEETSADTTTPDPEQKKKTEILERLESLRFALKRSHGLIFDTLPIQAQCDDSALVDCAKIVQDAQIEMNRLAVEKEEQKASMVPTPTPVPAPSTVITINQPPIIVVRPRHPIHGVYPRRLPQTPNLRSPATPPSTRRPKSSDSD
jgi:hypothetical protein